MKFKIIVLLLIPIASYGQLNKKKKNNSNYKLAGKLFNKARQETMSGQYQDAMEDYNKYIQLLPNRADGYLDRGQLKDMPQVADYAGAIEDFNKGIKLSPKDWNLYYSRGCAKDDLGDYFGAMSDYSKAIEIEPEASLPYYTRGLLKIKNGNKQGGLLDLSKSGELGYTDAYKEIKKYSKE